MNWRRGLVLAAINLLAAVPQIVSLDLQEASFMRERSERSVTAASPTVIPEGETVSLNPCEMTDEYSLQEQIVMGANTPASVLTGWREVCPLHWTLAGRLHAGGWPPTPSSTTAQYKVDCGLLLLITFQWILVGGFPLRKPRKAWREPGMFITVCVVIAIALVFIPFLSPEFHWFSELFALITFVGWLWWLGLLLWKIIRSTWRWSTHRLATL